MNIAIDEKLVQEAINKQADEAVKTAFGDYKIKSAIEDAVSKAMIPSLLSESIEGAVSKLDLDALSSAVAREITRSTTRAVQHVIREAMVGIIIKIRGIHDYDRESIAKAHAELMAEFDRGDR